MHPTAMGGSAELIVPAPDDLQQAWDVPRPRLLMLTHRLPVPPDRGDRIRSYHLIQLLRGHFDITLGCVSEHAPTAEQRAALDAMVTTHRVAVIHRRWSRLRGAMALALGRPATPACFYRRDLVGALVAEHRQRPFDAVLTYCSGMAGYARAVLAATPEGVPMPRHVLDLVDVDSSKWASYAAAARGRGLNPMRWVYAAEARRLRPIEAGRRVAFDAVTVVSEAEADEYRRRHGLSDALHVAGNGVDVEAFAPPAVVGTVGTEPASEPRPPRVVFVGQMDYKPNVEAVYGFVERVMPKLRVAEPDAVFRIVGRNPTPEVRALGRLNHVEVTGEVESVAAELREADVVVAPLSIARGVQNKVLEAMAAGRAVVCSPAALEGIDAEPGREVVLAEKPEQWARVIVELLRDRDRAAAIGAAAREHVVRERGWAAALAPMLSLLAPTTEPSTARVA